MSWPWVALILAPTLAGGLIGVTLWLHYRKGKGGSDDVD